jgi:putative nucleotidyltransferase with HDIG domain
MRYDVVQMSTRKPNPPPSLHAPTTPNLAAFARTAPIRGGEDTVAEALDAVRSRIDAGTARLTPVGPLSRFSEQIANQPVTSRAELVRMVHTEPALASRLLQLANTRYQDVRRPGTASLERAVTLIGPARLKLMIDALGTEADGAVGETGRFELRKLWTNTLFTALAARALADTTQAADPEIVFTAALFHNAGEALLVAQLAQQSPSLDDFVLTERLEAAVRAHHTDIGAEVLKSWSFPAVLVDTARNHHGPIEGAVQAAVIAGWLAAIDYGYAYLGHCWSAPLMEQACGVLDCRPSLVKQVTRRIGPALNEALTLSA